MNPGMAVGPVVLLVEDDVYVRNALARLLHREGIATTGSDSPAEARRAMDKHAATLRVVIVDLELGEESGLDLVRELHGRKSPPEMIVFSAQEGRIDPREFADQGVRDVLTKPASPAEIVAAVRHAIHGGTPRKAGERMRTHPSRGEHRAS